MRPFTFISFLLLPLFVFADNTQLSEPLDIENVGYNKVLQMSNGNTLLFHLEPRKKIQVIVFGTDRKEIANNTLSTKIIDVAVIERSELHGIYEINDEAVIFISQPIYTKESLIRLRVNPANGKLIAEEVIIKSETFKKSIEFNIARYDNKGYAVFCMIDLEANHKEKLKLLKYDEQHNQTNSATVNINTEEYDYVDHVSTEMAADGSVMLILNCKKIIHYPNDIDRYLTACYLPDNATDFNIVQSKLPDNTSPYYTIYTINPFDKRLNLVLINAMSGILQQGLLRVNKIIYDPMFLSYNQFNLSDLSQTRIKHINALTELRKNFDSTNQLQFVPITAHTNQYGLTVVASEVSDQNVVYGGKRTGKTLLGNIAVSFIVGEGKEIWGTCIPKTQYLNAPLSTYHLNHRNKSKYLFRKYDPYDDWIEQYSSFNFYYTPSRSTYIIFNDLKTNYNKIVDSIYTTEKNSNTMLNAGLVCYKISKDKQVTKTLLFDSDTTNTNISYPGMVEGADFNETTNTYACLLIKRNGEKKSTHLGWVDLE